MLHELLTILRSNQPLEAVGEKFSKMLELSLDMVRKSGEIYCVHIVTPEQRTDLQKQDVKVNKLERKIRKQITFHLSVPGNIMDLPYCLVVMILVKDVERIGDYAKELADLVNLSDDPLPDDEIMAELKEVRTRLESDYADAIAILDSADRERAIELISCGRDLVARCEQLIENIAYSDYKAGVVATLVLGVQFYQRIAGHTLNLLSSVVMPLHKLDYYDEKDIAKAEKIKP